MKIAFIGATGKIGQEIAKELLAKNHSLTNLTRSEKALPAALNGVAQKTVDILDIAALTEAFRGHDIVVSAFGPGLENTGLLNNVTQALIAATRAAGIKRLVVIGGAGSLEVAPGVQLVDTPEFPAEYHAVALAHRDAFNLLRQANDLDWTFFAPAGYIYPGEKKGNYKVAANHFLTDAAGKSMISYGDYAEAFANEVEQAAYPKAIITVAYS